MHLSLLRVSMHVAIVLCCCSCCSRSLACGRSAGASKHQVSLLAHAICNRAPPNLTCSATAAKEPTRSSSACDQAMHHCYLLQVTAASDVTPGDAPDMHAHERNLGCRPVRRCTPLCAHVSKAPSLQGLTVAVPLPATGGLLKSRQRWRDELRSALS
jgi:hypothetical protein